MVFRGIFLGIFWTACLVISAPWGLKAQTVHYSEAEAFDFRTADYAVVGRIMDQYYAYRGSAEGHFLDLFDAQMEKQATVLLDFISGRVSRIRFYIKDQQIMVLYQLSEGRQQVAYAARLDPSGRMQGRPQRLATADGRRETFYTAISENHEHLVVYHLEQGQDFRINLHWVSWDDQPAQRQVRIWPEAGREIQIGGGMVSNRGAFYLPVYTNIGNAGFADQLWLMEVERAAAATGAQRLTEEALIPIPLEENLAAGTYMKMDNIQDRIWVGGFYAARKNGNLEGVMSTVVEKRGTGMAAAPLRFVPFDGSLRLATGDHRSRKALNQFQVRDLVVKNDGGFVLIAEDYYITTRHGYSSGFGYYSWYYPSMSSSVREYRYGDILVASYDGSGQLDWYQFVRKDQFTQEDGGLFSSFLMVNTGGAIGFMFNDFMGSRSRVRLASVDGSGEVQTQILGEAARNAPDWIPRQGEQISAREVMVPCLIRRKICFAKLTF